MLRDISLLCVSRRHVLADAIRIMYYDDDCSILRAYEQGIGYERVQRQYLAGVYDEYFSGQFE